MPMLSSVGERCVGVCAVCCVCELRVCCVLFAVCCVLAFRQLFFAPGDYSASFTVWIMDDSCYEEESEYVDLPAPTTLHPHVRIAHPRHPKPHAACGHVHAERLAYMRAPSRTTVPFVWLRVRTHTERLVYMPPRIAARSPQPHFCLTRPVLVLCFAPPPRCAAVQVLCGVVVRAWRWCAAG